MSWSLAPWFQRATEAGKCVAVSESIHATPWEASEGSCKGEIRVAVETEGSWRCQNHGTHAEDSWVPKGKLAWEAMCGTGSRIWAQVENMQALWSPDDSITRSAARHGGASLGVCMTGLWSYFDLIFSCFAQFCPCWNGNIYSATVCWTHMTGFLIVWSFQLRDDLSLGRDSEL